MNTYIYLYKVCIFIRVGIVLKQQLGWLLSLVYMEPAKVLPVSRVCLPISDSRKKRQIKKNVGAKGYHSIENLNFAPFSTDKVCPTGLTGYGFVI